MSAGQGVRSQKLSPRAFRRTCTDARQSPFRSTTYIRYEIEGHRKLLAIQEVYLKSPDNLDETNVAKLARGMIKEHLALLGEIDKAA